MKTRRAATNRNKSTKVMLIVENTQLRKAIRTGIDANPSFRVVAEAGDAVEAALAWAKRPDVIVRDARAHSTNL